MVKTSILCGILFAIFSFTYLYALQGEILRTIHKILSEEKTVYSPIWGAAIITIILCLLQFGLNLFTKFKGKWQAISYFPAFLILTIMTDVHLETEVHTGRIIESFSVHYDWTWKAVLTATICYAAIVFIYKKRGSIRIEKESLTDLMVPNLFILILFSCLTGSIGNSNENLHYELSVAQNIREKKISKSLIIGKKSLISSRTLTALRAFALSQVDSLGQSLFTYPQYYGAGGLFFDESRGPVSSYVNQDIYDYLGGSTPNINETTINFLQRICEQDEGNYKSLDYYLCALLLEKQLERFVNVLHLFYDEDRYLPKHYQEALILYKNKTNEDTSFLLNTCSDNVYEIFKSFISLQKEHPEYLTQRNYMRRKYGDTYWWYYWYAE